MGWDPCEEARWVIGALRNVSAAAEITEADLRVVLDGQTAVGEMSIARLRLTGAITSDHGVNGPQCFRAEILDAIGEAEHALRRRHARFFDRLWQVLREREGDDGR